MKGKSSNNPTFFSKTLNVVKNPFFIIGFIFLISIITYFVINHKQSNPAPPSACDPNTKILCAGICIDKSTTQCVNNKQCSNANYCPDPVGGNNTCCSSSQWCDPSKNACSTCPEGRSTCSGNCCDVGETCTKGTSDGNCCITEYITTNGECCSPPSTICKSIDGKTTTCCNPSDGKTCDPTSGICAIGCPDIKDMKPYMCPGDLTPPPIPTKSILCPTGSICTVDCSQKGDNRYACATQDDCQWGPINYQEGLLQYDGIQDVTAVPTGPPLYQCSDKNSKYWIKQNSDPSLYANESVTSGQKDAFKKKLCNLELCKEKIEEGSTSIIKGDPTLDGNYICSASIDCSKALLPNNNDGQTSLNNICTDINSSPHYNQIYNNHGRCCSIKNINTGQVCDYNQFCDFDQNCYSGFTYNGTTGRCEPSTSSNQTFQDCLTNTDLCKSKGDQCTDWTNCFCCPKYKNCNNCEYTYKMTAQSFPIDKNVVNAVKSWANTTGADHIIYIYIPECLYTSFSCDDNSYYYKSGHGNPGTFSTSIGTLFDDTTTCLIFGNTYDCYEFKFTLNNAEYTVQIKNDPSGICTPPDYSKGNGYCINIILNGNKYSVVDNNSAVYFDDAVNAWGQVGNYSDNLPGRIWISAPAPAPKQSNGSYKYLNWPNACPTTPVSTPNNIPPNILPDHHKKRNGNGNGKKNINLFIFMIFIIIFLLVLYFFRN